MAREDDIAAPETFGARELSFELISLGGEQEAVALIGTAMQHAQPDAGIGDIETGRKACHPGARSRAGVAQRIRAPAAQETIASRAFFKAAAAIIRAVAELPFSIAGNNGDAPVSNELGSLLGRACIGDDITRANHMPAGLASRGASARIASVACKFE